ncbi:MAG: regulatory iron-sulfur-containing complex subunit RicT, partial [Bacteroidales bacterium]|nr:regulatory iron-sulfur-containing complex subunit RicT [Bacteroidales bacterium]
IAAFVKERKEKRHNKPNRIVAEEAKEMEQMQPQEGVSDPYSEPDADVPRVPYSESPFLWRGCSHCPISYEPVKQTEMNSCGKLSVHNWLKGIRQPMGTPFDCVEVRFKNNRKEFFRLPLGINVVEGDVVSVEGTPGHDVGIVSLTGELCRIQMRKKRVDPADESLRKLYRRAKALDIEQWADTIRDEHTALIKTRCITEELGLQMKTNDVEFQGDRGKAIFYYTADDRVDFRQLIKVLAETFHVRVEMKQIGVRQEAAKVGGLGTCGRELCCSTWLTNFKSVTTGVAKTQQILPNPQKLAGQCGKLKCCLNFEYEVYQDALKRFPQAHVSLRFKKGVALYKKTDVFRGVMWYAYEGENELYALKAENVKEVMEMNRRQEYPERMEDYKVELMSTAALVQETSEKEFEQAIRELADHGGEVVTEDKRPRHENREPRKEGGDRRSPRDRGGRDNRDYRDNKGPHGERSPRNNNSRPHGGRGNNRYPNSPQE